MLKAVILAAGKGTRMGNLTATLPKPMVQVHDKPILQWIIEGLRDHAGVKQFFVIIGYQGDVIRNHFGDGSKFAVSITYGVQEVQDGTGKAPELAASWIGRDRFLMTYGDILIEPTDYGYLNGKFAKDGVIALKAGEDLSKGGAVVLDTEDWMIDLIEKSTNPPRNSYYNAGIYILTPAIFEYTRALEKSPRGEYEFTDALKHCIQKGGKLRGVQLRKSWVDVRDPGVLASLNARP
jgi:UDP-N-acetylglucosamine diphosphorylase / glucose-1-phosphate thymidylyltransferase / UDP-N-acetylgalactosamine diphosphorylase / glucosamine-1-phosphate N-acetyltransferase / galactosamine-1-phosphate N-acetyltransferase